MQAPINIIAPVEDKLGNTGLPFSIDYNFAHSVPVLVQSNGVEIVVKLLENAGAFKIVYRVDGRMLSFHPRQISFRFPAEHTINSYRLDGEIIIVCEEVTPYDIGALSITNGLEFVIPIQFNPSAPEYEELNELNPDMWRIEVTKNGFHGYRPKDPLTSKNAKFKLRSFMHKVMLLRSDSSMYMGTATTPPCAGNYKQ